MSYFWQGVLTFKIFRLGDVSLSGSGRLPN